MCNNHSVVPGQENDSETTHEIHVALLQTWSQSDISLQRKSQHFLLQNAKEA